MSAFTAVSARRGVGSSTQTQVTSQTMYSAPSPAAPAHNGFSSAVRAYVQRAFAEENKISSVSGDEMRDKLKDVINAAANSHALDTIDWANHPLPQQMILAQRGSSHTLGAVFSPATTSSSSSTLRLQQQPSSLGRSTNPTKKRKSNDLGKTSPPWRTKANPLASSSPPPQPPQDESRNAKKQRFQADTATLKDISKSNGDLERRRLRFENGLASPSIPSPTVASPFGPVIGTRQKLEKRYLRLTSAPDPEQVRPLAVLQQTLQLLKTKWKDHGDYAYICDQFKSMRQDLTVQHIKNEFTVQVYEVHARIALERGDIGEYNQCQSQLRALYRQNVGGRPAEFLAYRILYLVYTCNRIDMGKLLAELTPAERAHPDVRHALRTRSALARGDYHRFFRLYMDMPNMGAYLVDKFVDRERLSALASLCKVYKPDVPLRFVTEELGFESDQHTVEFLCERGADDLVQRGSGDEKSIRLLTGKAGAKFEQLRQEALQKIDIKGQI